MIVLQAPDPELRKSVMDEVDRLHDEAEDALDENRDEAEEIAKYHGDDTKDTDDVVSKEGLEDLQAMHLSESLFEDLDEEDAIDLADDISRLLLSFCEKSYRAGVTADDLRSAIEKVDFDAIIEEADSLREEPTFWGGLFDDTEDALSNLSIRKNESLSEELSATGKKLVAELKQELGPELQKKVVALMKDLENSYKGQLKQKSEAGEPVNEKWSVYYEDDIPVRGTIFDDEDSANNFKEKLGEGWVVTRLVEESGTPVSEDLRPERPDGYRYITKHGIGPGTIPRDVHLISAEDLDNFMTAIWLSRPLTSEELKFYDIYPEWIQDVSDTPFGPAKEDNEQ